MDLQDDIRTIIVHDNCTDGLLCGILLKDIFPNAEIRFIQYQTADHQALQPEPGMIFADFSPQESRAQEFIDAGAYILDHHKKAKDLVARFGSRGAFGDEVLDPGVCGAVLVFRELWSSGARPWLVPQVREIVTLAGIRDTWQNKSPRWRDALIQHEVLWFYPKEWWMGQRLSDILNHWESRLLLGSILVEKSEKGVRKAVESAHRFTSRKGTRVVVFEGIRKASDAAELIGEDADLIIGFGYFEENTPSGRVPKMVASTRSHTTFDCMRFCAAYGGGGHTKAAGFNVIVDEHSLNPYKTLENLLNDFESR